MLSDIPHMQMHLKLLPQSLEISKHRTTYLVLGCYPHLSRISNGFSTSFNILQDITTHCVIFQKQLS